MRILPAGCKRILAMPRTGRYAESVGRTSRRGIHERRRCRSSPCGNPCASEVRHAFGRIYGKLAANLAIRENFGWTWFKPPAGTPRELIVQVLAAFRRPAIYVETAPRQWTLEVFCRDLAPVRFVQTLPAAEAAWPPVDLAPWGDCFPGGGDPLRGGQGRPRAAGPGSDACRTGRSPGQSPARAGRAGPGRGRGLANRPACAAVPVQPGGHLALALTVVGAILLAVIRLHPSWGILLTVIFGLAFVRTAQRVGGKGVQTSGQQLNLLVQSCGMVF